MIGGAIGYGIGRSNSGHSTPAKASKQTASSTAPPTFTVTGGLDLKTTSVTADDLLTAGGSCAGKGGFDDISEGTQVVISDKSGTTLALGQLSNSSYDIADCHFDITVDSVPAGKSFYKVEVSHRGGIQFTESQLREGITLSLGDGS